MAGQNREQEGDNEQRRAKAREAREQGELPSAQGATLGASKQRKEAKRNASHQERIEQRHEGKEAKSSGASASKPRPGNRAVDPNRGADHA
jgi:hypothetical protein